MQYEEEDEELNREEEQEEREDCGDVLGLQVSHMVHRYRSPSTLSEAPSGSAAVTGPTAMRQCPAMPDSSDEDEADGKGAKGSKVEDLSSGEEARGFLQFSSCYSMRSLFMVHMAKLK